MDMDIRHDLHSYQDGERVKTPPAFYILKPAQRNIFIKFLKGVKFLDGFTANLGRYITPNGSKVQG